MHYIIPNWKGVIGRCGLLIVLLSLSCGSEMPAREGKISQDQASNQKAETDIQLLWEARVKELDLLKVDRNLPVVKLTILQELLSQATPEQIQNELERIRSSPTSASQFSAYDQTLLQAFVENMVKKGDRDGLVYLLTAKCPGFVGVDSIELYLADSNLPNPLLVLFDSYEKATTDDSKRALLDILTRVFRFIPKRRGEEKEFLAASKDWYLRIGNKLKINIYYHPVSRAGPNGELFIFEH